MADAAARYTRGYLIDTNVSQDIDPFDIGVPGVSPVGNRLTFQYNPEKIKKAVGVTWAGQVVPGMSHRRLQWGGGGARSWSMKLQWYLDDDTKSASWVLDQTRWLESITVAEFDSSGSLVNAPHVVLFVFGKLTGASRSCRCVLTSLAIEYGSLFTPDDLYPRQAEADITLEEYVTESIDYKDYRR